MHGEGGRCGGATGVGALVTLGLACVELWGWLAYSSTLPFADAVNRNNNLETEAMNPLNNHRQSLILGIVIAVVLALLLGGFNFYELGLARWFHIVSGVFWIGLLYYFNVAQTPAMADAAADKGGPGGAGITKYVAPRALFWFRWSALATWLGGAWLLGRSGNFLGAFTFGAVAGASPPSYLAVIGTGAWLGTIMLFNVWGLIWPNQKKILGIVAATDAEKATARKIAGMASRVNFVLSIPMIMCMAGATHGLPFIHS